MDKTKELENALSILNKLEENGFEAYLVGGWVRDRLLGIDGKDIDITTNAVPEKVKELFPDNFSLSEKFQTVVVRIDDVNYEITTYRHDKRYKDHRHPITKVAKKLQDDVVRRDFTINALAMDKNLNVIDYVGGENDLKLHIIRAVGKAKRRFNEDALRMFRAFRFAARLGFSIEEDTYKGIVKNYHLVKTISKERIRAELEETISAPFFKRILSPMLESLIMDDLPELKEALLHLKENYLPSSLIGIACLSAYLTGHETEEIILTRKEKKYLEDVLYFIGLLKDRNLAAYDLVDKDISALYEAMNILSIERQNPYDIKDVKRMEDSLPIKKSKDLKISGDEIKDLTGCERQDIKEYLSKLTEAVVYFKVENNKKDLISYLKGIKI